MRINNYDMFCLQVVIGLPLEKINTIIFFLLLVSVGSVSKRVNNEIRGLHDRSERKKQGQSS